MTISLQELRKFAIQEQTEITFREEPTRHCWRVSRDGIVKFGTSKPWGEIVDYTPESTLALADEFSLEGPEKARLLTRAQMTQLLAEALTKTSTSHSEDES
ncbi:MAG TPA: hypothetical protein VMW38_07620 [Terriglobia bacterium]|nr:hypothetical protein [Terriglobia bacterium]